MALFAAVMFVGFIATVTFKKKFDYDGNGQTHEYNEITRINDYPLRGNLATYEFIDDDELKLISDEVPEYENFYDIVIQMRKERTLNLFTLKITDDSDIQDKLANKTRIMCAYDLTSQDFYWHDQKGKRTLTALMRGTKTRNIVAVKSRKITIIDEDNNEVDWYIIVPHPTKDITATVGFGGIKQLEHTVVLKDITNATALVKAINFSGFVADAITKNKYIIDEKNALQKFLDETSEKLKIANQKIQSKDKKLGQKAYWKEGKTETKEQKDNNVALMLGGMFVAFVMIMVMPSMFPEVEMAGVIGFGISLGVMGLVWKVINDKKPQEEEFDYTGEQ